MENEISGDIDDLIPSIFSSNPNKISLEFEKTNEDSDIYLFESLLEILFKGIIFVYGRGFDINKFGAKHITTLNKYFQKIGFKIMMDEIQEDIENNHYCKILLKQIDEMFFIIHNIDELYHFVINVNYNTDTSFEDIYALLPAQNKRYHISFYKIS